MTREQLKSMSEAPLRLHLVELFRRMGYQDVDEYHSSVELGKDILMWEETSSGRVNIACVVKAGKITGQANTKQGNAGEVATQVMQAFGSRGLDTNLHHFTPDRIFVICNGEIKPQARSSIRAIFDGHPRKTDIDFWGLEKLWKLTGLHFSAKATWARLKKEKDAFLKLSGEHYRFELHTGDGFETLAIHEKYEGASRHSPLGGELSARFQCPERFEAFRKALQGRAEFDLQDGETIILTPKGVLKDIHEALGIGPISSLKISPVRELLREFRGSLSIQSDNEGSTIRGLTFQVYSYGDCFKVEITGGPFSFVFTIDHGNDEFNIFTEFKCSIATIRQFGQWLTLRSAIAEGGQFVVDDYDLDRSFEFGRMPPRPDNAPPQWMRGFARNLLDIEQALQIRLRLEESISEDDLVNAWDAASLLRNDIKYSGRFSFSVGKKGLETLNSKVGDKFEVTIWHHELNLIIMGQPVRLPRMLTVVKSSSLLTELPNPELAEEITTVEVQADEGTINHYFKGLSEGYFESPNAEDPS